MNYMRKCDTMTENIPGYTPSKSYKTWTKKELTFLEQNKDKGMDYLSKNLKRSRRAIKTKIKRFK